MLKEEESIINKTAEIWNEFTALEQTHPSDVGDMAKAIHQIQHIISIRMARRTHPNIFVTIK